MKNIDKYKDPKRRREYLDVYNAKWRLGNVAKEYHKNYARKVRKLCIEHYGNKCVCCDETYYEFLTIDHINGGGGKHRKLLKGYSFPHWLQKNKFPDGYQILCYNCNNARSIYGICPHDAIPFKTGVELNNNKEHDEEDNMAIKGAANYRIAPRVSKLRLID